MSDNQKKNRPERVNVEITGIMRNVSPAEAPLGSCQDMVNLRVWDGALRPVRKKTLKFNVTASGAPETPAEGHTLTVNIEGEGSVMINGSPYEGLVTFPEGFNVFLIALPDEGYLFAEWNGDLTGNDSTDYVIMDGDKEITAIFNEDVPS
jgi:hypothetical protein